MKGSSESISSEKPGVIVESSKNGTAQKTKRLDSKGSQGAFTAQDHREAYRKAVKMRQSGLTHEKTSFVHAHAMVQKFQLHLANAHLRHKPGHQTDDHSQAFITTCLLASCPVVKAARVLGYKQAADEMGMAAPAATTVIIASVMVSITVSAMICSRYGRKELGVKWDKWEVLKWMRPGCCSGLSHLCFLTGAQKIAPVLSSVAVQTAPLITILVQMVFRGKRPDTVSLLGAILTCSCATQFTAMQAAEGDDSGAAAFNIVGFFLVVLSVVFNSAGILLVEMAAGGPENEGRNHYAMSLNCILLNDLSKIPLMVVWALVMERDAISDLITTPGVMEPFLLGACMPLALLVLVANSTAVLCGSFWMTMACSLEVMVVYIAGVILFGDRVVLAQALSLFCLFIAVLTINHAVSQNHESHVETLEDLSTLDIDKLGDVAPEIIGPLGDFEVVCDVTLEEEQDQDVTAWEQQAYEQVEVLRV